ncbi:MAG TPA: hypothetical protein VL177_05385 [Terriglobales bacterium]|jgi:hypothetical protein|nr:hypothetical protein [Terriglobales bacterium]
MRNIRLFGGILLLLLTSCGRGSWGGSGPRFVNRTGLAEAEFQALAEQKWQQAQRALATHTIDLHAATPESGPFIVPADARALQLEPHNVVVQSELDVAAQEINNLPNCAHCPYEDPTGLIRCRVGFCQAYLLGLCTIVVPSSKPENMGPYEMENCILWALGYEVSGR